MSSVFKYNFWILLPLNQKQKFSCCYNRNFDILHEAYLVPHAIKSTARKYNVDPNKIHIWRASLTGLEEEVCQYQLALLTSFKGWAKKTLQSGKVHIDTAHYGAIKHMFNILHNADWHVLWWCSLWNWRGYLVHQYHCLWWVSMSLAGLQVCIMFTAILPI